jgi:hypothetical protein
MDQLDRREDDRNGGSPLSSEEAGGPARAFDAVERLGMRRYEDLEAVVVRAPADQALGHGRHIYRRGRTVARRKAALCGLFFSCGPRKFFATIRPWVGGG